jgi:hypothetical protein
MLAGRQIHPMVMALSYGGPLSALQRLSFLAAMPTVWHVALEADLPQYFLLACLSRSWFLASGRARRA